MCLAFDELLLDERRESRKDIIMEMIRMGMDKVIIEKATKCTSEEYEESMQALK